MDKKKTSIKSYIFLVIILVAAIFFIMNLLETSKNERLSNPMTKKVVTESYDLNKEDVSVDISGREINEDLLTVKPFSTSLKNIISNSNVLEDFKIKRVYNGVIFDFNCSSYDKENVMCTNGSALMKVGKNLIPLFTYSTDDDNYFNNPDDYYIIVNDNLIILSYSVVGVNSGMIRIYDYDGNNLVTINNALNGFKYKDELRTNIYPQIIENKLYYNVCESGKVVGYNLDLNNVSVINRESVKNGSLCY